MNRILYVLLLVAVTAPATARQVSWRVVDGPYGGTAVTALAARGDWYAGTAGGIFVSADGGQTWSHDRSAGAKALRDVRVLLPMTDGSLLAGTYGGGVFRLSGGTWSLLPGSRAFVLSVASSGTGILYSGTSAGLMRSIDGGQSWTTLNVGGKRQLIASLVASADVVMTATTQGIYRSEDRGQTWTVTSLGLTDLNVTALYRTSSGTLFAGLAPLTGGCALFRSRSEGRLWSCVEPAEAPLRVESITQDAAGRVHVAGYRRVLRSDDEGNTWSVSSPAQTVVKAVAASGNTVLAGTAGRGIVRSANRGLSYEASNRGIPSAIADVVIAGDGTLFVATAGGVFARSTASTAWTLLDDLSEALAPARSLLLSGDGTLLVGTTAGVRRFDPRSQSWAALGPPGNPGVRDLAQGPDGSVYMGYYEGVYRMRAGQWTSLPIFGPDQAPRDVQAVSVDASGRIFAGASWDSFVLGVGSSEWTILAGATVPYFEASVFSAGPDGSLYAGTRYAGVLRSTDGGIVWSGFGDGLMGSEDVRAVSFDRTGRPWVATFGSGAYRFDGFSWINESAGLEDAMRLTGLVFDTSGRGWAGTDGGGLFVYDPAASTARSMPGVLPDRFAVGKPWPNPASERASVLVDLPNAASVTTEIFDVLGRLAAKSESGTRQAGSALEIDLPVAGLPNGLYIVRIGAGPGRVATTTLVVGR